MATKPVGTAVAVIDLDSNKMELGLQRVHDSLVKGTIKTEDAFKQLGIKSDKTYLQMAENAALAQLKIVTSTRSTSEDIIRAQQAYAEKSKALYNEQNAYKIALMQKENQANAEYWQARMAQESAALQKSNQANADYWNAKMAREKAAISEANNANAAYWQARMAYEKQATQQSAQEAEKRWQIMGIRPTAAIEADKAAVLQSYATLTAAAKGNQQELINLERAKNDQLKKLNAEMVGDHEISMASMTRTVLRFYAAYYVVTAAVQAVSSAFQGGMRIVDEYNQSIASLAAMAVTFSEKGPGVTLEQSWEKSLKYSTAMIPILEEIAAKTILSGTETTALANAFARSGVFLDGNNQKQIESFTRISNALPLMTQGQEIMRQINTEIRSVMTGANESSSMMLTTLKALPGFSMELLQSWRDQGTVLEHLGDLLDGFGPATKILEIQWTAVKSTLETTVDQILRGGMKPIYEDIIALVKDMDKWLKENKATIQEGIVTAWELTKGVVGTVWGLLEGFGPLLSKLGEYSVKIAQGWALVFAIVEPIGEAIGRLVEKAYLLGEMLIQVAKISINPFGDNTEALASFQKARNQFDEINEKSMLTAIDDNLYAVNKTIEAYRNGEKEKTDASDASLMNRKNSLDAFRKAEEKLDAQLRLNQSNNISIVKENELNALKDMLRGQQEYKDKVKGYGSEAAEAWVTADAARIQSEEKRADKSALKEAAKDAREYEKSLVKVTDEYYRLAIASGNANEIADARKKEKIWQEWEKEEAKMTDVALAARDLALAEVDMYGETAKAREKEIRGLEQEEQARLKSFASAEKALNNLEQKNQLAGQFAAEWDNAMIILEKALDAGVIGFERFLAMQDQVETKIEAERINDLANYYQDIIGMEDEYREAKLSSIEAIRVAEIEAGRSAIAANAKAQQAKMAVTSDAFLKENSDRQQAFGSMKQSFSDMANLYAEDSRERQALSEISKAATIAEMALQAEKNLMIAVGAVVNQGTGDPYSAFARIAAMIAVVGSVLSIAGIGFSSGGGVSSVSTVQTQGSTGVLGADIGTGSASIENSLALMQDTYDMEDTRLTKIYDELRDLNSNITGLVTSIVRTGGITVSNISTPSTDSFGEAAWDMITEYTLGPVGEHINDLTGHILGSITGSITEALFGGSTSSGVQWYGIEIGQAILDTIVQGGELAARQFAVVTTVHSGGAFASDWTSRETFYGELDPQVVDMLTLVYAGISETLIMLTEELGTDMSATMAYVFERAEINLEGMNTEQMNTAINEYFSKIADTAVNDLFGEMLRGYQKLDEGLYETAVRLVQDKLIIENILKATNQSFNVDYTRTTEEIIAFSEAMIDMAGDLETLTDAVSTYYSAFFTEEEQQARLQQQLSDAMVSMNLALPATRDGYRDIVESLDLTTESGMQAYVTLMKLSGSADEYYKVLEDATTSTTDNTDAINEWVASYTDYYNQMMGLNTSLGDSISGVNESMADYISKAVAFGASTEQISLLYEHQGEITQKLINDWLDAEVAYYEQMMGLNTALGDSLSGIAAHYDTAIKNAIAAGATQEQINEIVTAGMAVGTKAVEDWAAAYLLYYDEAMDRTTNLGQKIADVNEYYAEQIAQLQDVTDSTAALTEMQKQQAEVINQIVSEWGKAVVQPLLELETSIYEWAQAITGMTTKEIAINTAIIKASAQGWYGIAPENMNADQLELFVTELANYYTTIANSIMQTYEALQSVKSAISGDIESITVGGMSVAEKSAYYANRVAEGYRALDSLASEDLPEAMSAIHADLMSYYDAEKQVIQDRYQTEIDAIEEKHQIEIQNIEAVRDKLQELTYSQFNLALPTARAATASQDYASMFAAAQTGDADSVSSYLSFVNTYLQESQNAYKSSQTYLDIYAQVMRDIASLDTSGGRTIEDITSEQNSLIEAQTAAMNAELALLNDNMTGTLELLNQTVDSQLTIVANELAAIYVELQGLIATGYGIVAAPTSTSTVTAQQTYTNGGNVINPNGSPYGGYADGGISYGKELAWVSENGPEAHIPLDNGFVPVKISTPEKAMADPEVKNLLTALVAQGAKRQNVTITLDNGRTLTGYIQSVADGVAQTRLDRKATKRIYT